MALARIYPPSSGGHCYLDGDSIADASALLAFVKAGGLLELRGDLLEIDGDINDRKEVLGYQRGVVGNAWFALPYDAFFDKQRGIKSDGA